MKIREGKSTRKFAQVKMEKMTRTIKTSPGSEFQVYIKGRRPGLQLSAKHDCRDEYDEPDENSISNAADLQLGSDKTT